MTFAGLNWLAIVVAAAVGFGVAAVWYTVLAKPWMDAAGLTEADIKGEDGTKRPSPIPFIIAAAAQLVIAYVLAGVIGHMGPVSIRTGLISALFIWFGFVVTTMSVNYAFQLRPPKLTVIDAGHWLAVIVAQGLVIGAFGT